MMLWFDVTDLQRWPHSHLTGIQRTVVGVLSELLQLRDDVILFAYDEATGTLYEATLESLSETIKRHLQPHIMKTKGAVAVEACSAPPAPDVKEPEASAIPAPPPERKPPILSFARPRAMLGRFLVRSIGVEATEALRDFVKSGFRLFRILIRKFRFLALKVNRRATEVVKNPTIILESNSFPSIAFRSDDVCLSLSATWGIYRYGEVIAENKGKYQFKYISMIYDLIPTLYPQWLIPGVSRVVTLWVHQQIRNADVLLTISNFQKEEIATYIRSEKLPSPPIEVVRLGDNPKFSGAKAGTVSLPRFVPERKFAICVSTLDVRKNHNVLYQVWRRMAEEMGDECPQLLLIGITHLHVTDLLYQIEHDRLVNRLIIPLNGISDEELAWYYRQCQFTLYPSIYEGWGLPISESLAMGKYCIAGDRTSLPEAGGDFVDYFDPIDVLGCYRLVRRAIENPDYVKMREANIRGNYKPYTWKMTAESISEIVDRCISENAGGMAIPVSGK